MLARGCWSSPTISRNWRSQLAETLGRRFLICAPGDHGLSADRRARWIRSERDPGLCVLADMGDNSGGGAPGDATYLLAAMLARGLRNFASGMFWDPGVVRICQDAGIGSTLTVRLGGKTGAVSGDPIDLRATVMNIETGLGQHLGTGLRADGHRGLAAAGRRDRPAGQRPARSGVPPRSVRTDGYPTGREIGSGGEIPVPFLRPVQPNLGSHSAGCQPGRNPARVSRHRPAQAKTSRIWPAVAQPFVDECLADAG